VGSAVRTNARWRQHRSQLQRGTHHSRYLQAAWSKYGAEGFEFVVLEIVPTPDELLVRENAPHDGRPAALSPGVPLDAVVGPRGPERTKT